MTEIGNVGIQGIVEKKKITATRKTLFANKITTPSFLLLFPYKHGHINIYLDLNYTVGELYIQNKKEPLIIWLRSY